MNLIMAGKVVFQFFKIAIMIILLPRLKFDGPSMLWRQKYKLPKGKQCASLVPISLVALLDSFPTLSSSRAGLLSVPQTHGTFSCCEVLLTKTLILLSLAPGRHYWYRPQTGRQTASFYLSQNPESLGFVSPIAPPAQDLLFIACISLQGKLPRCSSISSTGLWAPWGHIYLAIPCAEDRVCSLGGVQQLFVEWTNKWFRGGVNPEADSPVKIVAEVKYCRPLHGGPGSRSSMKRGVETKHWKTENGLTLAAVNMRN